MKTKLCAMIMFVLLTFAHIPFVGMSAGEGEMRDQPFGVGSLNEYEGDLTINEHDAPADMDMRIRRLDDDEILDPEDMNLTEEGEYYASLDGIDEDIGIYFELELYEDDWERVDSWHGDRIGEFVDDEVEGDKIIYLTDAMSDWDIHLNFTRGMDVDVLAPEDETVSTRETTVTFDVTNDDEYGDVYDLEAEAVEDGFDTEAPEEVSIEAGDTEEVEVEVNIDEGLEDPTSEISLEATSKNDLDIYSEDSMILTYEGLELSVDSTEGGTIIEPGKGTFYYENETIVYLEAVPFDNHTFIEWTGDVTEIEEPESNSTTIKMLDDHEIKAEFSPEERKLDINSTEGGEIAEPGEGEFEYNHGEEVDLEAKADQGFEFIEWTGDNETIEDTGSKTTTIIMKDDYEISAEFEIKTYDLTVNSTEHGVVVEPGEDTFTYEYGTEVSLEALPDENYTFIEWRGDNGTIEDTESQETTIFIEKDHDITAVFDLKTYELEIDSMVGGDVEEPGEGSFEYAHGEEVNLQISEDEGHSFIRWTGDNETILEPEEKDTSIEIFDDYHITAEFEVNMYNLTVNSTEHGVVVEPGEDTFTYEYGTEVSLEALPDENYTFIEWTGDNGTIEDPKSKETTITIEKDHDITAVFDLETYILSLDIEGEGMLKVNEEEVAIPYEEEYEPGTQLELESLPDEGWYFGEWTGDMTGVENVTTITMESDMDIEARFVEDMHELTIYDIEGEGSVEVFGEEIEVPYTEEFGEGVSVELDALADDNFTFVEWTGDVDNIHDPTAAETIITMENSHNISAVFEPKYYELKIDSLEGGEVLEPGVGSFEFTHGEKVYLEAAANLDHTFVEWTGDTETIEDTESNQTEIEMLGDYNITAEFEIKTYTLTLDAEGEGVLKLDDAEIGLPYEEEYEHGTQLELEAIPDEEWYFGEWTGDMTGVENVTTITMESDMDIEARFVEDMHELTIYDIEGEGSVEVFGEEIEVPYTEEFGEGVSVELDALADDNFTFVEWTGDVDNIHDPTAAETIITMENSYNVSAVFELKSYELKIDSSEGGEVVEPGEGSFEFKHGDSVDLEAVSDENYKFVEWAGDIEEIEDHESKETTIKMIDNHEIEAVFSIATFDLTIESTEGGYVTEPGENTFEYQYNETITLNASSKEGWQFVSWTGFEDSDEQEFSFNMPNKDITMEAQFERKEYTLSIDIEGEGSVRLDEDEIEAGWSDEFEFEQEIQLEAHPSKGWEFKEWSGDHIDIYEDDEIIFEMPANDTSITANFERGEFMLEIDIEGDGSEENLGVGNHSILYEEDVELEASPEKGWYFEEWTDHIDSIDHKLSFEMPAENVKIVALFEIKTYDLNTTIVGEGSIDIVPEEEYYEHGEHISLIAEPDYGWVFGNWSGDTHVLENETQDEISIEITDHMNLTAEFVRDKFDLRIEVVGNGTTNPSEGVHPYEYEEEIQIDPQPDLDWHLTNWTIDGETKEYEELIVNMTENRNVTAYFGENLIKNVYDLQNITEHPYRHYTLANDIDATVTEDWNEGKGFEPIAAGNQTRFEGELDGDGHIIDNLYINRPKEDNIGLFSDLGSSAVVEDVGLREAHIIGKDIVGGIAGSSSGLVTRCYTNSVINGEDHVGGIIGRNSGKINITFSAAEIDGIDNIGGIAGWNLGGIIEDSYFLGNVLGDTGVAGVTGINNAEGNITNVFMAGEVDGEEFTGSLVGDHQEGSVDNAYWVEEMCEEGGEGAGISVDKITGSEVVNNIVGFDFTNTWEIVEEDHEDTLEDGYPILRGISRDEQIRLQDIPEAPEEEEDGLLSSWIFIILGIVVVSLSLAIVYLKYYDKKEEYDKPKPPKPEPPSQKNGYKEQKEYTEEEWKEMQEKEKQNDQ